MNLLLDTHVLLWWLEDGPKLPDEARHAIQEIDNVVYVSAATTWEIAIKRALGKLEIDEEYVSEIADQGFQELPIRWAHAKHTETLPLLHRDPFDRLLVAQAQALDLTLVTTDETIRRYRVDVLPKR